MNKKDLEKRTLKFIEEMEGKPIEPTLVEVGEIQRELTFKEQSYSFLYLNTIPSYYYYTSILHTHNPILWEDCMSVFIKMVRSLDIVEYGLEENLKEKPFLKQDLEFIQKYRGFLKDGNLDLFNKHWNTLEERILKETPKDLVESFNIQQQVKDFKRIVHVANINNVGIDKAINLIENI